MIKKLALLLLVLAPTAATAQSTVVPEHFLRRWDPVTIFFDRATGPESGGPEDHPERFVTFSPEHPGAFNWLDANTLQFRPVEPWPPLARFQWHVEGSERTTLITLMSAPTSTLPKAGSEGLEKVDSVTLTFPEPMDPEGLARMASIELRDLPGVGFQRARWLTRDDFVVKTLERKARSDTATYVLALSSPIPAGTRAIVHLRLSLDDTRAESFTEVDFATVQPFRVREAGCRNRLYPITREGTSYTRDQAIDCGSSNRSMLLRFSAPPRALGPVEARNLVRFTPPVDDLSFDVRAKTLEIAGDFDWDTLYRVNLAPVELTDDKGRTLEMKGVSEMFLFFPRKEAYLRWKSSHGVVERLGPQMVPLEGRAHERLDLRIYPVDALDRTYWPFSDKPVSVDEAVRPPGPGETVNGFAQNIQLLGSPPVSTLVGLPLSREGGAASFGLDLQSHLERLSGDGAPGTYLVGIRSLDETTVRHWMRLTVSDLSLSTIEEIRAVRFHVTSIATGRPIPGAIVRLEQFRGHNIDTIMEATTDSDGTILWPAPGPSREARTLSRIIVAKGDDVLVLDPNRPPDVYADNQWTPSNGSRGRWLQWTLQNLSGRTPKPEGLGHIFTERPIYRPADTVHIKGYLRRRFQGTLEPITGHVNVIVEGPGDLSWRYPVELTSDGSFYHAFTEEKLPTGEYQARVTSTSESGYATVSFRIEAYRLPRFEVQLHSSDRVPLDREFDVNLTASYYAGGRVAERPIHWRVTQFPFNWTPKRREGFLYSSDGRFSRSKTFTSSPKLERLDQTDGDGAATLVLNPAIEPTAAPRSYVVEATVTGADDQTVTSTRRVVALPAFVLGLKVPRYIERAQSIEPEVIVVGTDDELIAGTDVTVRLKLRQWHSILRASDFSDGVARYKTDVVDETVFETTVTSGADPVSLTLPVDRSGVYIVELEAHDRLDRAQVVAVDLYAGGDEPVTWSKPVNQVFTVSMDQNGYDPGETAHLVLESPFQSARALAVIEGPERNDYHWVSVEGGTATFDLDIETTYVPRIPVHFVLMRGRIDRTQPSVANGTDLGKPATMAATAWVSVRPVDNRVEVSLSHPERALPGEEVEIQIELRDPDGNPRAGELSLWLVDQAVLALGKEQRLDPLPDFITDVRSRLQTRDTRNDLFGFLPFVENPGGGEGEQEALPLLDRVTVRKNFQPVPYFNPRILVGSDGAASVRIELPDDLTNFKLRAKAASGPDRFGYGTGTLAVRLPVIVQPALPRFVRPGDRFTAAAVGRVVEGDGGPGRAEVDVTGVDLEGDRNQEIDWVPNRPERIEFAVEVSTPPYDESGELSYSEVSFRVAVERTSDEARDAFEVKVPVLDDRQRVTRRLLQTMTRGEPVEIPSVDGTPRPGTVRRRLLISDQPALVTMAAGLDFLLDYPYGCTEQRISRARSQLALKKFRELLHLADPGENDEALERAVRETVEWIQSSVDGNGLTAYWPGARGYVSLTAWVLQFLVEAEEAGFPVDAALKTRLQSSLEQSLRSDYSHFIDGESWAERTWALSALAASGKFSGSYAAELSRRSQNLNLESVSQVLVAFNRAGESPGSTIDNLSGELWDGVVFRLYQGNEMYGGLQTRASARNALILPSETRTLSEMTRALARTRPGDERLQLLVNAIVTLGRGDGWGSTNANASALLALSELVSPPFEGTEPARVRVSLGDENVTLRTGTRAPVAFFVRRSAAEGEVTLESAGSAPVVVRAETSYVPAEDGSTVEAQAQGFVVTRDIVRLRPEDLSGGLPPVRVPLEAGGTVIEMNIGDVMEDHVQVVNPQDRNYIAVFVPLAAGMEPLNPNLATSPPEAAPSRALTLSPTYTSYMDDHVAFYYDQLPAGTYDFYFRTRATTEGSFIQPAARAEMMYDGAVFGHSVGARVEVARVEE